MGSAAAPLIVGAIIAATSWRVSVFVVGGLSLIWAIVWMAYLRDRPKDHQAVTSIELEELDRGDAATDRRTSTPWRSVVPALLPVAVVDFCYGWLLWVYITWLPTVFQSSFGLDLGSYALHTSLVLAAGALMLEATGGDGRVPLAFSLVLLLVGLAVSFLIPPHRRMTAPEPAPTR